MRRILSLFLVALATPAFAAEPFFFQKGDRVVFLGDSITAQYEYSSYIELYLTTRFPDWNLMFLNAGIGGDTAHGGANRFQSHVLDEKPTAITINFGMNDAGYGQFNKERNAVYVEKTAAMLDAAKKAGVRVALVSPNAVDRRKNPSFKLYVETQKQFYAPLKDIAANHGGRFADQYAMTRAAVEKMEGDDPTAKTAVPYYDGFHTSPPGGLLMAHAILTGLGAPAKVSDATIDAGAKSSEGDGCKIENLSVAADSITFDRTDAALPLPIQKEWLSILPYVNDLKDLNWYGLKAKGLTKGIWEIRVDGKLVAKASADDLEKGINLGNATTGPIFDHAQAVYSKIRVKNSLVANRFFGVINFAAPDWLADVANERRPAERAKRLPAIEKAQAEVNALAQPKSRKFELKMTN